MVTSSSLRSCILRRCAADAAAATDAGTSVTQIEKRGFSPWIQGEKQRHQNLPRGQEHMTVGTIRTTTEKK